MGLENAAPTSPCHHSKQPRNYTEANHRVVWGSWRPSSAWVVWASTMCEMAALSVIFTTNLECMSSLILKSFRTFSLPDVKH